MTQQPDNGNGDARPSYLDSLVANVVSEDRRCLDWVEQYPHLRHFLLGDSKGIADTGTSFSVTASQRGLMVMLKTVRYGYEARYEDVDLHSILEAVNNDLDTGLVPWQPDWRRRRENSKRLEL